MGIILIIILTFSGAYKDSFPSILIQDLSQLIMSNNLGFSHQSRLLHSDKIESESMDERATENQSKLSLYIQAVPQILDYKLRGVSFNRLDLEIPFLSYEVILKDRDTALQNTINVNPSKVKALLRYEGQTFKSSIRLKGDSEDHWKSRYRMSLRVELKGEDSLLGFKEFSIQKPHSRQFPYDFAYQSSLQDLGNMFSVQKFVHLFVNGKSWGIMNIEEHMTKEFLEKQKRKESLIIKIGNEDKWTYSVSASQPYEHYLISDGAINVRPFRASKYMQELRYRKILSYISQKQLTYDIDLYDVDSFLTSYVLSTLWAQWHTLLNANHRYYFNPYTLKLESISLDQGEYGVLNGLDSIQFSQLPIQFSQVLASLKENPRIDYSISKIIDESRNSRNHFARSEEYFPVNVPIQDSVLKKNSLEFLSRKLYYLSPEPVDHKGYLFTKPSSEPIVLPTQLQASEFHQHIHFKHYSNGRLEIYNLLPDTVEIKSISIKGIGSDQSKYLIPGYSLPFSPTVIQTGFTGLNDQKISIVSSYQGFERENINGFTLLFEDIYNPLLDNSFECSQLCIFDGEKYVFAKGRSILTEPLIIKGDVLLLPGTHLSFGPNAYLIIEGSLESLGTIDDPVLLEATQNYWKGLYVLKSSKRSVLTHTKIMNLAALEDGLLQLTGGITFYKADVDLKHVEIHDVVSEDALNIISSNYSINENIFSDIASDAFDSDFSDGHVQNTSFVNINGDALDFSGSRSDINNVRMNNIGDKGISAGEESTITVINSHLDNLSVGVISKDNSDVIIQNSTITNFKSYGVMSFIKKDFYSKSSSLKVQDSLIDKPLSFMRQKGTFMEIDSMEVQEQIFNVDKFYTASAEAL